MRARDGAGCIATGVVIAMTALGIGLSLQPSAWAWLAGQVILALAFLQWFIILHEAGHRTLFRSSRLNSLVGHLASVFSVIPYYTWRRIHARHHKYTGWQDLDATTALLVPREVKSWERFAINFSWATSLPLFSILYRFQNFWNLPRLAQYISRPNDMPTARMNVAALGFVYLLLVVLVGPLTLLSNVGLALLLSLMAQDVILLSQHTHMPRHLSKGGKVRCFSPAEQEKFTRSLRLPAWISRLLLGFDLHELHHMYVQVPGYDLHSIPYQASNEVNWLVWLRGAKALSGMDFLFGCRERTGFKL
jgi:fatty acid desaturase